MVEPGCEVSRVNPRGRYESEDDRFPQYPLNSEDQPEIGTDKILVVSLQDTISNTDVLCYCEIGIGEWSCFEIPISS